MFLPDANNLTGKVTMLEIFNPYVISPTYRSKLRDRTLESIKVAWAGEENDTLDADRAVDGIVESLGEHLRGEVTHLRPKGPPIVPGMAQIVNITVKADKYWWILGSLLGFADPQTVTATTAMSLKR